MFGAILSAIGGAVKGVAGLVGGALGLVGKTASAVTSTAGLAVKSGATILGDLPEAASKTIDSLSNITSKSLQLYETLFPKKVETTEQAAAPISQPIYTQAPAGLEGLLSYILSAAQQQQPTAQIMTTPAPAAAAPAVQNYLIYAAIAIIAILLLRKR